MYAQSGSVTNILFLLKYKNSKFQLNRINANAID